MENAYHMYALEWTDDALDFFMDDIHQMHIARPEESTARAWPFDADHFIILNLAVGGNAVEGVDATTFAKPAIFDIDYVRVYKERAKMEAAGRQACVMADPALKCVGLAARDNAGVCAGTKCGASHMLSSHPCSHPHMHAPPLILRVLSPHFAPLWLSRTQLRSPLSLRSRIPSSAVSAAVPPS